jgi:LPS O-antigen subunit length determinant protein (WzzB/FepE family)
MPNEIDCIILIKILSSAKEKIILFTAMELIAQIIIPMIEPLSP